MPLMYLARKPVFLTLIPLGKFAHACSSLPLKCWMISWHICELQATNPGKCLPANLADCQIAPDWASTCLPEPQSKAFADCSKPCRIDNESESSAEAQICEPDAHVFSSSLAERLHARERALQLAKIRSCCSLHHFCLTLCSILGALLHNTLKG